MYIISLTLFIFRGAGCSIELRTIFQIPSVNKRRFLLKSVLFYGSSGLKQILFKKKKDRAVFADTDSPWR